MNGKNESREQLLITETLTHKVEEADTSGNQRNVSHLGDTSILPALFAAFLLKAMAELNCGAGVRERKSLSNKS